MRRESSSTSLTSMFHLVMKSSTGPKIFPNSSTQMMQPTTHGFTFYIFPSKTHHCLFPVWKATRPSSLTEFWNYGIRSSHIRLDMQPAFQKVKHWKVVVVQLTHSYDQYPPSWSLKSFYQATRSDILPGFQIVNPTKFGYAPTHACFCCLWIAPRTSVTPSL